MYICILKLIIDKYVDCYGGLNHGVLGLATYNLNTDHTI